MSTKRKCFCLNIKQKKEICEYYIKNPSTTHKKLAVIFRAQFGGFVSRRTVGDILANKEKWMSAGADSLPAKRLKPAKYKEVEDALGRWAADLGSKDVFISDTALKEKAREIGNELGLNATAFQFSHGWIDRCKKRCGINSQAFHDSSQSVAKSSSESIGDPNILRSKLAFLGNMDKLYRPDSFYAHQFGLPKHSASSILDSPDPMQASGASESRDRPLERTEAILNDWIMSNMSDDMRVSSVLVRQMAQNLYKNLTAKTPDEDREQFKASKVWLTQFIERFSLDHLTWVEESMMAETLSQTSAGELVKSLLVENENSKLEVDQDNTLIGAIEPHRCLYDPGHEGYHDADLKKTVWQNVAKNLGLPVNKVKTRWHILEKSYRAGIKSAQRLPLFRKMSFLKPHLQPESEYQCASTQRGPISIKSEVFSSDEEFADTVEASPSDIGAARTHMAEAYKRLMVSAASLEEKDSHEDLDMKVEEEMPDDRQSPLAANSSSFQMLSSARSSAGNLMQDSHPRKIKAKKIFTKLDEGRVDPDLEYFKGFLSLIKELSAKRKRQLFASFAQMLFQHLEEQESKETDST